MFYIETMYRNRIGMAAVLLLISCTEKKVLSEEEVDGLVAAAYCSTCMAWDESSCIESLSFQLSIDKIKDIGLDSCISELQHSICYYWPPDCIPSRF